MTHQIFSHSSKIAFVACNVCNVAFTACDKHDVAYIACIKYIALKKEALCLQLSEFLKTHRKREARLKVFPKHFFTTTVYFILLFCLSHEKEMISRTHLTQQNVFLPDSRASHLMRSYVGSWGQKPIEDMTSLGTDFETHANWQGYIEEPTAMDFVARKGRTIALSKA
jgi:hypothetical protein